MVPSRDIPAGRSPQGWRGAPAVLSAAAGWPGAGGSQGISREQSGCWQPAPRGGRVPRAAPAGVGENAQKAPGVCVLSPWQPRLHHRGGPAKTSCCGRRRDGGRRSSIPYTWGDIWGVSQWCDRGPGSGAERVTVHPLAALSAWLCFHHMAPSSLLGDRAQIPCARLVPGLGAATNTQPGSPGVPGQL